MDKPGFRPFRVSPILRARLLSAPIWVQQILRTGFAPKATNYACTSLMLARSKTIGSLLGERPVFYSRLIGLKGGTILGWGRKWSGLRAIELAARFGREFCLVEDGFMRSVERDEQAHSLLFDRVGIYYDATLPSELEQFAGRTLSISEMERARALMSTWRSERLSKYNSEREGSEPLPRRYVLVCDQTFGDASVRFGGATKESFGKMLSAALAEYPEHEIVLKTHPDVMTNRKKGYFDINSAKAIARVRVISDPLHPVRLIENADAVYTVTSQLGFEALIWGKRVRCFGMPFYAGWGLTNNELPAPVRRKPVTLEQLAHASLIQYPRYLDLATMRPCEPERSFAHVGLQKRKRSEFPQRIAAVGFSRWKRPFIEAFLRGSKVSFLKELPAVGEAKTVDAIAIWGASEPPEAWKYTSILRIEDGFLRSSGLGADLVRPLSLVVDDIGIYYDATRPSRLEKVLETDKIDCSSLERARALRDRIIKLDLSKYNLGSQPWSRPNTDRRVLLVVGQVESDSSIRFGSPDVKTNIELLYRVRNANPSAYIVYKPHPDVVAGLRRKGRREDQANGLADEILTKAVSVTSLVQNVDEFHTMTSLLGFEALMRGGKVVCHGMPFYAGWGLTHDKITCPRRTRVLNLDELVFGALISYPRYYSYEIECFIQAEDAVERLAKLAQSGPEQRSWFRKALRQAIIAWLLLKRSLK